VNRLWVLREVVPEHVGVLEVRLWVTLLRVDEVGELGRVAQEEDGCVVENPVKVALLSAELDGEAAWIASRVGRSTLATDRREAHSDGRLLALAKELGAAKVADVVRCLKDTVGSATLGVNYALGNALSVKVSKKVDVVEVLQQERTAETLAVADALSLVWLRVRRTVRGGVEDLLGWRLED